MLTKDEIIKAKDLKTKVIEIPEWNGSVEIQALTLKDMTEVMQAAAGVNGTLDNLKLSLATFIAGVLTPKFERKDVEIIQQKNSAIIARIVNEITKLSGYGTDQKNG